MGQEVTATELKSELDKNGYKETTVTGSTILRVKFEKTGHIYMIKTNGEIAMSSPSDKDPDKKIVEILGSGIALTESEKVVTLGVKTEEPEEPEEKDWQEMEALEEISEINGVYKKYSDGSSYYIIDNNRNLYAWGNNEYGQLGIGNTENQSSPVQITGISDIIDVYIYWRTVIAKDSSGNLYAWGENDYGQLGIGNTENQLSPVQITGISNIVDVYTDGDSVIAKDSSGNLYAWGKNECGKLGIGSTDNQTSPVLVNNFVDNKEIESFVFSNSGEEEFYIVANDGSCYLHTWFVPPTEPV